MAKPANPCHGCGCATGEKILTRTRARDTRTRNPVRVCKPVSITMYRLKSERFVPKTAGGGYRRVWARSGTREQLTVVESA